MAPKEQQDPSYRILHEADLRAYLAGVPAIAAPQRGSVSQTRTTRHGANARHEFH